MTGARPSVWAPRPRHVDLLVGDRRTPMARCDSDWWLAPEPIGAGTDYAFSLDGGDPLPDPRSPWQPHGVHGRSRTVDHGAFGWTDAGWRPVPLAAAVIYELHVGTFTPQGTFDSAIERLGDLAALGVTHVELMPVAEFSGDRGWGYDGVDLFAPHHAYGGPDGLKRLVDAAHAVGLAVLVDVVYNHLGPEGNVLDAYGPYFTDAYATPWGRAINVDQRGSHEVRRFIVDNARMWLRDYHADGLRLDAIHAIVDTSAVHVVEEIATAVHGLGTALGRPLVVVAESDLNDPRVVRPRELGGHGADAAWADDVHHALHVALTGEASGYYEDFTGAGELPRALRDPYLFDDRYAASRGRRHGRPAGDLDGSRFVAALQNHDQVGNRARGERIGHLVSPGRARIGAALLVTAPYVPLLFAGEEWAASAPFLYFTAHEDPALGRAVSEGRRSEFAAFGWDPASVPDPQDPATFAASKLEWTERSREPHASMLAWYRDLLALRAAMPELRDGDRAGVVVEGCAGERIRVRRGRVTVAANLGAAPAVVEREGDVRLAWPPDLDVAGSTIELPPDGTVVMLRP